MTLKDIEKAVTTNCIIDYASDKKLAGYPGCEDNSQTPLCLFIGISMQYGYSKDEIIKYLELDNEDVFNTKYQYFLGILGSAYDVLIKGEEFPDRIMKRFYGKYQLVSNYIRHKHGLRLSIADIFNA